MHLFTMRNRLLLLLLSASVLGTPVVLHWYNAQQQCLSIPNSYPCLAAAADPIWVFPFGVLSAVALIAAAVVYVRSTLARRKERDLLGAAGVQVAEQDLPLEE